MKIIFTGSDEKGDSSLIIRKSKLIFFLIVLRSIFLISVFGIVFWGIMKIHGTLSDSLKIVETLFGLAIVCFVVYYTIRTIMWIYSYFYDVFIVANDKIYKFKIGLFHKDNVEVIELYRVQEFRAISNKFWHVFFDVGHLELIESNNATKMIHRIDNPKRILFFLQEMKDKLIEKRRYNN